MADAFGRAVRDCHRDDQDEPLIQRDGEETLEHPIEAFYLEPFDPESVRGRWLASHLEGPLVDLGAGAGRDALYFQKRFETVAIERSDALVETMAERGVDDPRRGDMFALREQFDAGRFHSVSVVGTQTGLAGSMAGLESFLADLAWLTDADGTAVLDGYDPTDEAVTELLGVRTDETPGLAHRVMTFEYGDAVDPILYFRLFSPDRLCDAAAATAWSTVEFEPFDDSPYYLVALGKE